MQEDLTPRQFICTHIFRGLNFADPIKIHIGVVYLLEAYLPDLVPFRKGPDVVERYLYQPNWVECCRNQYLYMTQYCWNQQEKGNKFGRNLTFPRLNLASVHSSLFQGLTQCSLHCDILYCCVRPANKGMAPPVLCVLYTAV